ncbi:MAG TPA: FtsQ-type POTRA domain-containing protein [Vicinamibacterales bacterium]|nr:FtsQ-type POTRA domain-containing protein [Vicinamibacterales bacterium]
MERVLARREHNRLTLQQYILDEVEEIEVLAPGGVPLLRRNREFTWYVRDGLHVRSPVRFEGVGVGERERKQYEEDWARRERERLERKKNKEAQPDEPDEQPVGPSGATPIPTPRFVSEAYFMEFKFEPGNYYLAGREQLDGKDVLRIEYYPTRLFEDDDSPEKRKQDKGQEYEDRINRQMNKTALVTLWVDPAEHQIVKYTFDNVWMDFLPGAWLVRVDEIGASMSMGQPFPGVWLPREMSIHGGVTLASGSFDANYRRRFSEYRQAEVKTRITIPKPPSPDAEDWPEDGGSGPYVPDPPQAVETIAEIRVHGNASMPDADVIGVAGISPGQPFREGQLDEIRQKLERSGLFESVDVRKRYRSLTDTSAVALLLVVHEKPGVTSASERPNAVSGPWRRFRSRTMFLPILSYSDGYGFTYGGRASTVDLLGLGERLSVPLTWGGTRRAALEFERAFDRGPLTRVTSSFGIWQRENPHYDTDDQRVEWRGRAERSFISLVRTGAEVTTSSVDFGSIDDRLWTFGADVALDTRGGPAFPRNAVYVGAGWTALDVKGGEERVNRYTADARGYLGLIGQSVLAGRVQYTAADASLPIYERLLLGGASNLRGFRTGAFSGDRMFVTSAELRVPLTSVLNGVRLGVTAFADAARVYDIGQRFDDAEWHRSAGGGVFLIASVVRINLDVARGFKTGDTRVHLGMGFPF